MSTGLYFSRLDSLMIVSTDLILETWSVYFHTLIYKPDLPLFSG